jgi:hypothetical protein
MEILNLADVDALNRHRKPGERASISAGDLNRIVSALRDFNRRVPSGLGYFQWHGIIDMKRAETDAKAGADG